MRSLYHCIVLGCLLAPVFGQTFVPLTRPFHVGNPSAFDSVRQRLVMLDSDGTTWELDGGDLLPRTPQSGAPGPVVLAGHAMCYDEARRRVLLFGGLLDAAGPGSQPVSNDTWAYDGSGWTRLTAGLAPAARSSATLTWDATRNRVVMWGGLDAASQFLNDTWEHDGSTWLQRSPATSPTPGLGTMVFDRQRSVAVLVSSPFFMAPAETWEWNGTAWAFRANLSNAGVDGSQTVAFDPSRNRTVLTGTDDRVHEWDGVSWTASAVLPQPFQRTFAASWFDPGCGCVTLAGGGDRATSSPRADRWQWNGQTLTQVQPDAGPTARDGVMFPDPPRGRMVHFGGFDAGTNSFSAATWALANGVWSAVPSPTGPSGRMSAAAAYHPAQGESLLFGGLGASGPLGDTWSFGSAGWVARSTTGPSPRRDAAMATDLVRGVIVLFGGFNGFPLDDTWEWNGTLWTQRATTVQPSPRSAAAMAFHPTLGRLLLFGGLTTGIGFASTNDTWTWNGSQWAQLSPATVPPPLTSHTMGTDLTTSRCTLIGTANLAPSMRQHTWIHSGTDWQLVRNEPAQPWDHLTPCANTGNLESMVCSRRESPAAVVELTFTPGRVTTIGAGCGTPASTLMVRSRPRVGTTTGFELVANPARAVLFGLDLASGNTPLGGGCTVWLSPGFLGLFQISNASGFAEQPLLLPANPALRGLDLFTQAAVLEPASSNGLVLTQGLRLTLGD